MTSQHKPLPFNRPHVTGREMEYVAEAHASGSLAGDGPFTKLCHTWIEQTSGCRRALLTHSCTAALEMSALLLDIGPGDEVIMPSYTFVSTANAFVLRGATPVFVDVREDTLNLDERQLADAITPRTRAIVPVHYAGVACDMEAIMRIADEHGIAVVEDAAQGVMSTWRGQVLGSIGHLGAYSFHETKNIIAGEGGALLVNDERFVESAEIIREKGTDRARFLRGEVDKYTWREVGSSYLPGELIAAFLWAQLEQAHEITNERLRLWDRWNELVEPLERRGVLRRPVVPDDCQHNAHMYYVLLDPAIDRGVVLEALRAAGIGAVFHYVPLHSSPVGRRVARAHGDLEVTADVSARLVRLPLFVGLTEEDQDRTLDVLEGALRRAGADSALAGASS